MGVCALQAIKQPIPQPCKIIVFPGRMGTQNPIPQAQPEQSQTAGYHPPTHGNWAQWVAPAVALLIGVVSVSLMVHFRNEDAASKVSDEHIRNLVDDKFKPLNRDVFEEKTGKTGDKIDKLGEKVDSISERVAHLEGPTGRIAKLETRTNQQISLARIMDPDRLLGMIRAELQVAQASGKLLPISDLDDYRNAVQALSSSARDYWMTAAAIINYQSLINQANGAPDPFKVSRVCLGLTTEGTITVTDSLHVGGVYSNCRVDLDTNAFSGTVFRDSVIRYKGGKTALINVVFQNCTFVLDLPSQAPAHPEVIRTLLSSDQKHVILSTSSTQS